MNIHPSRRGLLAAPAAIALIGVAIPLAAASSPASPCRWSELMTERRRLHDYANDSASPTGNVPDDVAAFAWGRVAEIDDEIAGSSPQSAAGLRAAVLEYRRELGDMAMLRDGVSDSLFAAMLAFIDGVAA